MEADGAIACVSGVCTWQHGDWVCACGLWSVVCRYAWALSEGAMGADGGGPRARSSGGTRVCEPCLLRGS